jgi:beta-glucosidase
MHAPRTRLSTALLATFLLVACGGGDDGDPGEPTRTALDRSNLDPNDPAVVQAQNLLAQMTLEEKVEQMSGPAYNNNNQYDQADNVRLSIPGWRYMDGPRGVRWYNSDNGTTVFPVAEARAASFDPELERLIGKALSVEMRYLGRHVLLMPYVNQVMHPRGGRTQEGYGEDTHLIGVMGVAATKGVQYDPAIADPLDPDQPVEPNAYVVQASAKHIAANNLENQRTYVNAVLDERTLREVYLPHFKKTVEVDVSTMIAAYNRVNGDYACYSEPVMRKILKDEWKYKGWVMSDWFANGDSLSSPPAGLDVEMPFSSGVVPSLFTSTYFYGPNLVTAVKNGLVDLTYVDEAVLRLLYAKIHYRVMTKWQHDTSAVPWQANGVNWQPRKTKSDRFQELALRAAREGMVLLKNGPTRALADDALPLERSAINKVALIGRYASRELTGDKSSSDAKVMDPELVITPHEGIHAGLPGDNDITVSKTSCSGATKCVFAYETLDASSQAAVAAADAVVVIAAYIPADLARTADGEEGEWKDRDSMDLPARDLANIAAAVALKASKPELKVVVVIKSGGVAVVRDWIGGVDAVLQGWYAGMREGQALSEILFGDVNPSGKLPQSIPQLESDLPPFDAQTVGDVSYDYFHGYRWLDKDGIAPEFAFGYGQSYTTFAYTNLQVVTPTVSDTGKVELTVDVTNIGPRTGTEIVQAYVGFDDTSVADLWGRPVKQLFAFARADDLEPDETRQVSLSIDVKDLAYWDVASKKMVVEKMPHQLYVGPSSDLTDPQMKSATFTVQ